jgi:hypothetical protein
MARDRAPVRPDEPDRWRRDQPERKRRAKLESAACAGHQDHDERAEEEPQQQAGRPLDHRYGRRSGSAHRRRR